MTRKLNEISQVIDALRMVGLQGECIYAYRIVGSRVEVWTSNGHHVIDVHAEGEKLTLVPVSSEAVASQKPLRKKKN
jgi:hypothetical protein